jgi:tetratricopeptide (TPR) repeat protein
LLLSFASGCWWSSKDYVPDPDRARNLPDDPKALVDLADRLLAARLAEAPPEMSKTDRALAAVEKALKLGYPKPYEALWRGAKASFLMTQSLDDETEQHIFSRRGIDYAQRAIKLDPDRVEGHFFLALNTAGLAQSTSNVKLITSMVNAAQNAAEIDKAYEDAGPLRFLGKVYITAPAWPVSVGDPARAVEVLKEAVQIAPVPLNRIFLGQAYYHDEDYENAEQQLRLALGDSRVKRIDERWRKEAQDYLRRIDLGSETDPRTEF